MNFFSIGDIVVDRKTHETFFILNSDLNNGTCTVVRKSNKHNFYFDWENDNSDESEIWDSKYKEHTAPIGRFGLIKSFNEQEMERLR